MSYYDVVCHKDPYNWFINAFNCLILACKFGERDDNVPLIEEMIKGIYSQVPRSGSAYPATLSYK